MRGKRLTEQVWNCVGVVCGKTKSRSHTQCEGRLTRLDSGEFQSWTYFAARHRRRPVSTDCLLSAAPPSPPFSSPLPPLSGYTPSAAAAAGARCFRRLERSRVEEVEGGSPRSVGLPFWLPEGGTAAAVLSCRDSGCWLLALAPAATLSFLGVVLTLFSSTISSGELGAGGHCRLTFDFRGAAAF